MTEKNYKINFTFASDLATALTTVYSKSVKNTKNVQKLVHTSTAYNRMKVLNKFIQPNSQSDFYIEIIIRNSKIKMA